MSLTLDAIKNNGLSPSLRRGAREGDVRDLCILTSYGGGRQPWKFCTRGAAHWMYTSPPSPLVGLLEQSRKPLQHIRRFGCTTRELRELVAWLHEFGVEHVAMESKGVYWKPGWNVLEGHFQIVLANAQQHEGSSRTQDGYEGLSANRGTFEAPLVPQIHSHGQTVEIGAKTTLLMLLSCARRRSTC